MAGNNRKCYKSEKPPKNNNRSQIKGKLQIRKEQMNQNQLNQKDLLKAKFDKSGPTTNLMSKECLYNANKFTSRCRLFIGNLATSITEEEFRKMFQQFGEVTEVFLCPSKGFGFVKLDTRQNAEIAKAALDFTVKDGKSLKVRFANHGAALKVKNLSSWVSNELLEASFSIFGDVERAVVIVDDSSRSVGEGIVEFACKESADLAIKKCQEGCFLLTSSPCPVIVEPLELRDEEDGLPEKSFQKTDSHYLKEREIGPRLAKPGTFEFEFANRYKKLYKLKQQKKDCFKKEIEEDFHQLNAQILCDINKLEANLLRERLCFMEEQNKMITQKQDIRCKEEACRPQEILLFQQQELFETNLGGQHEENMISGDGNGDMMDRIPMSIKKIVMDLQNPDQQVKFSAAQKARKILSRENPPIDTLIASGVVPVLVSCLTSNNNVALQFEACWALSNIASNTSAQTRIVVEARTIPIFVDFLSSPNTNIVEQAVWALGNIAGDCPELRDLVISHGVINLLVTILTPHSSTVLRRSITWTLSNLCRNTNPPPPPSEVVKLCLPTFAKLINHSDMETVSHVCWAIAFCLNVSDNEVIKDVINTGIVPRFVELLEMRDVSVINPVLRSIVGIVAGTDEQTQAVIDAGVLISLRAFLRHEKTNIMKDACWIVSNITARNIQQIQAVIDAGLIDLIVDVLLEEDFEIQKEAVLTVINITMIGNLDQIVHLIQQDVISALCNLFSTEDTNILTLILNTINILSTAAKMCTPDQVSCFIKQCNGLNKIKALQQHKNAEVCRAAFCIIDSYFSLNGDEDEKITPQVQPDEM